MTTVTMQTQAQSSHDTRHTLLRRACDRRDERAWREFHDAYKRFICYILNQIGIHPNDIPDVTQEILLNLMKALPNYDRQRAKFRTWLSSLIRNVALSHLRTARNRYRAMERYQSDPSLALFIHPEPELDTMIEAEWETYVATIAMERVRLAFKGQAITVFEMGLSGCPPTEIVEKTGLSVASVYTLRKRVKKRLYQEIRTITADLEP
jgi:RNA polymerase sigma factor (sigma-70 family)